MCLVVQWEGSLLHHLGNQFDGPKISWRPEDELVLSNSAYVPWSIPSLAHPGRPWGRE